MRSFDGSWLVVSSALLAVAGGCSGGGGGSGASSVFTFATPSATVTEGGASLSVTVRLSTKNGATTGDKSVEVFDAATGDATAGTDYSVFAPQVVTFPAGSVNGATQTVTLTALDDALVEGASETIELGLRNPSAGVVGNASHFSASISDVDTAEIEFAATSSSAPDESPVPRSVNVVLSLPVGVSLGVDVSAQVLDSMTGSAQSGSDYSTFATHTVTFAAGSIDGSSQSVSVDVLDDVSIELDEVVDLALATPSSGALIGANAAHALTILDDDASGSAALFATAGSIGTELVLDYDDALDLGSQTVGAGPNAGTRLRLSNSGGQPLALMPPVLAGSHPNDFAVEIESSSLAPAGPSSALLGELPLDLASPFVPLAPSAAVGTVAQLDLERVAALVARQRATLHDFPLPGLASGTVALERRPLPLAAGARLIVDGLDVPGGLAAAVGELSIWSGTILEFPGSRVFFTLSSDGAHGFVELPFESDRVIHIETLAPSTAPSAPVQVLFVRSVDVAALGSEPPPRLCDGALESGTPRAIRGTSALAPPTSSLVFSDCQIAIETDYQLYQVFGSTNALTNYVTSLMAAVSDTYATSVQTTVSILQLGVHSNVNDGWTAPESPGTSSAVLTEFRSAWDGASWPAGANLCHFLSGANLGGGVAYLDVLCNTSFGFGVSGNINGAINWNSWTGAAGSLTWDYMVVAHELGHNFSAIHTHEHCPPLDHCASNCDSTSQCTQGTIMSYCHTCGGQDNIDLVFHPVSAADMRAAVNSSCLPEAALLPGDYVQYRVRFNPLTSSGARSATLSFEHDAANEPQPFRLQLQGTGN
ncbi:MAG: hypothetical protein IT454_08720 [Planctomycetes bacterium]|nr:hypothetical protein [Planctomycetota bacterium]